MERAAFVTKPLNDVAAFQLEGLFSVHRTEVSQPRTNVKRKRDF